MDPNFHDEGRRRSRAGQTPSGEAFADAPTRTVDVAVILSGEIDMMLDETTVHVKAGDVVIQQAPNHAWVNRGTQPCRILFVLMDSKQP